MNRIDFLKIVRDHYSTLKGKDGRLASFDWVLYFVMPVVFSTSFLYFDLSKASPNIISAMSIFAGLLLNLLVLVFDVSGKADKGSTNAVDKLEAAEINQKFRLRKSLLRSIYNNISYSILVSVLTIFFVVPFSLDFNKPLVGTSVFNLSRYIFGFFSLFLMAHFAMNILMILKRMHSLLSKDI